MICSIIITCRMWPHLPLSSLPTPAWPLWWSVHRGHPVLPVTNLHIDFPLVTTSRRKQRHTCWSHSFRGSNSGKLSLPPFCILGLRCYWPLTLPVCDRWDPFQMNRIYAFKKHKDKQTSTAFKVCRMVQKSWSSFTFIRPARPMARKQQWFRCWPTPEMLT